VRRRAPTLLDLAAHLAVAAAFALLVAEVWLGLDRLILPTVLLAVLAVAGLFLVELAQLSWRRWTGESALVLRVFEHCDDRLQAGKYEARRAARIKRRLDLLSGNWRAAVRPAYRPGDVQMTRIHRYVRLGFTGHRPPLRRWRRHQVATVTLTWSSEARRDTPSFFELLEHDVAQALSVAHTDSLFARTVDYPADSVTFERLPAQTAADVPERLTVTEELRRGR
jgi:hypothetical protein